ncbi:CGNR zinc finger domain-containing protein [Streptomyces mirabilis]|nr:CGNR zinc finger domain-containing protein [Streptomyces mirabilis]
MSTTADPRPLTGEPVSLDLLNTRWNREGVTQDLLTDTEGLTVWLAANGLDFPADDAVLLHAREARDALRSAVDGTLEEAAARIDAVLAHGRVRLTLTGRGPGEEASSPTVLGPAWLAARDYLGLLAAAPDRIRRCAHDTCILHFFDTSRNGTRRWCSMAACGNRAKASRHYARTREA